MSRLRFNHVFFLLLALSGSAAFVVPWEYSSRVKGCADGVFAPLAAPVRRLAQTISGRLRSRADVLSAGYDAARAPEDAQEEIYRLRSTVANLTVQLAELRQLHANRELAGDVHRYAVPAKVIGGDPGLRETLSIQGTASDGFALGQAVVHRDGLVGRTVSVGLGGTQVRLITDRGFRVNAAFGRFQNTADGRGREFVQLGTPTPLVEGRGSGVLSVTNLTMKQVAEAGLKEGDWAVLRDSDDWPLIVNGYLLGYVTRIEEQDKARLFAQITIHPRVNALALREVMVVTGKPQAAASAPPVPAPVVKTPVKAKKK